MNQVSLGRRGLLCGALSLAMLVLAFAAPLALADSASNTISIDPDLPGTVGSTTLVGEGNVQVETSLARTQDGSGTAFMRAWSTPTLLRLGMPNYEVRLSTDAYSHVRTYNSLNTGVSDVTLGLKGVVPQTLDKDLSLSVIVQAGLPSGAQQVRNKGVRPELQFVGAWQLPNQNSIGAVAGVRSEVDFNDQRFPTGVLGMDFTHTWNPVFSTYAEVAARQIRGASRGGKNMMWALGAGWRAMQGTQLDATAGWGLKDNDTDMAFTLGISRRFHPPAPGQWSHKQEQKQEQKPDQTTQTTPSATTEDGK